MYSALDDLKKEIPEQIVIQLTDDEDAGVVNQANVDKAIADADAEIDSYCGGRYRVPFAVVPAVIKKISVDIAIYNLYSRKVESLPETREKRYNSALSLLKALSKGDASLGELAIVAPVQASRAPEVISNPRIFSRDNMKGL